MSERFTATTGEVLEYPTPSPETAAFLRRVIEAAHDPRVSEAELSELVYGKENPILDQGIFPGRGVVTKAVLENPLYPVLADLLQMKAILAGSFAPERARSGDVAQPALRVRMGNEPGRSLRVKALGLVETGRPHKRVVDGELQAFERVGIATSGDTSNHFVVIGPSSTANRIEWGPFFVEGPFRVIERVVDPKSAAEAWKAFEAR